MPFPSRISIAEHYLTARETEIVWYCANGLTTEAIAEKLFISTDTVKRHKDNIRERFNLHGYNCLHEFALHRKGELAKYINADSLYRLP
ncbi:response regulator transcription factor [Spirosoma flavum]|uniref:Response regulator transcription factor n=1 Tax=Spirosoma flavum TaxID=2048557 RepID=A0ABW6AQL6_9BACT